MKTVLLLLGYIFAIHIAEAQQPKKIQRIGYLAGTDAARESNRAAAIRQGLRDLGYIEGQNIVIEYGFAEGKPDRFAEVAADLVRLKVDVIVVTGGGVMVEAAKNATKTIPIVMLGQGADPVEAGLPIQAVMLPALQTSIGN